MKMNMNMENPYKDLIKIIDFILQEMEINPSANRYKIDSDLVPITSVLDGYRDLVQYVANLKKNKLVSHVEIIDKPSKTIDGVPITRYEIYVVDPNKHALIQERQRLMDFNKEEPAKKDEAVVSGELSFDENSGKIILGEKNCEIPLMTNQYFLCKEVFPRPFGTRIPEIEILDLKEWRRDTARSVYDAMRAVNEKTSKDLGVEIFEWRTSHIWIKDIFSK